MISTEMVKTMIEGQYWDSIADNYSHQRVVSEVDEKVGELLRSLQPALVVEIGCGPGVFAEHFITDCPNKLQYVGIDISSRFIEIAKERLKKYSDKNITLLLAGQEKMMIKDSSADVVVAMAVLHHFSNRALKEMFDAIRRILKPSAHFILVEDWAFMPSNKVEETAFFLRKKLMEYENIKENHMPELMWERMLQDSGFRIERKTTAYRPLSLSRFKVLRGKKSKSFLDFLAGLQKEKRRIPMSILVSTNQKAGCDSAVLVS